MNYFTVRKTEKDGHTSGTTVWGIKTHQIFYHNSKKSDPILISFGKNIFDTTSHQMIV